MGKLKTGCCTTFLAIVLIGTVPGCLGEGEEGESPLDCGEHGSEHEGHCHCEQGYLFDGEACMEPALITEICGEEETHDGGEEDHHGACRCPDEGDCNCDGDIETYEGDDYCVPELHDE